MTCLWRIAMKLITAIVLATVFLQLFGSITELAVWMW